MTVQIRNAEMVNLLATEFQRQYDSVFASMGTAIYRWLPGLRGFWPMTAIDGSGNVLDQSGNGLTLTINNTPTIFYRGVAGFMRFHSAATEYATRTDEAAFDIVGTESYIYTTMRGLTIGLWTMPMSMPGTTMNLMSKWRISTNERSYRLSINTNSQFQFGISSDGTATFAVPSTSTVFPNRCWHFVVGRFDPYNAKIDLFVNDKKYTNSTSIPASIFSGTGSFAIATNHGGTELYDGRVCLAFLCAAALTDGQILSLYHKTRAMFAVVGVCGSPSISPSASASPSHSGSPSRSGSPSHSVSPSISQSPSKSQSRSASISPSHSASPSHSRSQSGSESRSRSQSASQSPSRSVSQSRSVSRSVSPSASKSPSASTSRSPSPSPSP